MALTASPHFHEVARLKQNVFSLSVDDKGVPLTVTDEKKNVLSISFDNQEDLDRYATPGLSHSEQWKENFTAALETFKEQDNEKELKERILYRPYHINVRNRTIDVI